MENTDLSSVEFDPHGLGAGERKPDGGDAPRASRRPEVTNAYGTTEAGPVVFGPHPKGLPQPEDSVGYPHPEGASCAWSTATTAMPIRACWR